MAREHIKGRVIYTVEKVTTEHVERMIAKGALEGVAIEKAKEDIAKLVAALKAKPADWFEPHYSEGEGIYMARSVIKAIAPEAGVKI